MQRGTPLVLTVLLACGIGVHGQEYTHLSGFVLDPSGAAVPAAAIAVVQDETGFRRSVKTGNDGAYVISALQPGHYRISVRKEGFRTLIRRIKLDVAQPARLDVSLSIGNMLETITVESGAPLVLTEEASVGTLVGRDRIERLPLNGRGLLSLIELAPGTVVTPATRGEAGQFTANGQRPNTHYFTVDGVSANTGVSAGGAPAQITGGALPGLTALGSTHSLVSLEALEEFRVQTATTASEFGRLPGAQVSLSSRTGTNDVHASAFGYFRHEAFDARDWFVNRYLGDDAPMRLSDYGASLGAPLRRNRAFVFLAYEGLRLRQPFAWRVPAPTAELREQAPEWSRPLLDLFPLPNGPELGSGLAEWIGRNRRPSRIDAGSLRIDHALTPRVSTFGRYQETPSANEFGNTQISQLNLRSRSVTAGVNARLPGSVVLDFRANYSDARARSEWRPAENPRPEPCALEPVTAYLIRSPGLCTTLLRFTISGVGTVVSGDEGDRRQTQVHLLPSLLLERGSHRFRAGLDYRRLRPERYDPTGGLSMIVDSLQDLLLNQNFWLAKSPALEAYGVMREYSAFVQDTWRVLPKLTLNVGLRWEYAPPPLLRVDSLDQTALQQYLFPFQQSPWPRRYRNLAPRLGVAWSPGADGRTVIRAGGGLYYNSSLSAAADLVNGGPLSVAQYTSGRFGIFASVLRYGFLPGLEQPLVGQWSAALERAITERDAVSLTYTGASGWKLLRREIGGQENTQLRRIALATNHGYSRYHALQGQYRRRLSGAWQALVSYAYSHSIDNSSSDSALYLVDGGLAASNERGSSDFDVRHTLNAAFTWEPAVRGVLFGGWSLDGIFRARTGFPLAILQNEHVMGLSYANAFRPDLVGQAVWLDDRRAPGGRVLNPGAFRATDGKRQGTLGRNAVRGFGMTQLDLALRRDFKLREGDALQFRVEAFNLLNHPNFADPVSSLANPLFGQSSSMLNLMLGSGSPGSGLTPVLQTGGPRSLQLVLRLRF